MLFRIYYFYLSHFTVCMYELHFEHLEGVMLQHKPILVSQVSWFASALHLRLSWEQDVSAVECPWCESHPGESHRGTTRTDHISYEGPAYQSTDAHPKYMAKSALSYGQDKIKVRRCGSVSIRLAGYSVEDLQLTPFNILLTFRVSSHASPLCVSVEQTAKLYNLNFSDSGSLWSHQRLLSLMKAACAITIMCLTSAMQSTLAWDFQPR